jgi:hypothetical protein
MSKDLAFSSQLLLPGIVIRVVLIQVTVFFRIVKVCSDLLTLGRAKVVQSRLFSGKPARSEDIRFGLWYLIFSQSLLLSIVVRAD